MDTKSKNGLMTSSVTAILIVVGLVTGSTVIVYPNHAFGGGAIVDGGTSADICYD